MRVKLKNKITENLIWEWNNRKKNFNKSVNDKIRNLKIWDLKWKTKHIKNYNWRTKLIKKKTSINKKGTK
jgi:hypothetical protein